VEQTRRFHARAQRLRARLERVTFGLPAFGHRLDVAARAEAAAGARQHDDADGRIRGESRERFEHRVQHLARKRIQSIRPVHGQECHAILDLFEKILTHARSSWR
jgi:hypothetical protein